MSDIENRLRIALVSRHIQRPWIVDVITIQTVHDQRQVHTNIAVLAGSPAADI